MGKTIYDYERVNNDDAIECYDNAVVNYDYAIESYDHPKEDNL